jgi:hypothetical protein
MKSGLISAGDVVLYGGWWPAAHGGLSRWTVDVKPLAKLSTLSYSGGAGAFRIGGTSE